VEVVDAGHVYLLDNLKGIGCSRQTLKFMKDADINNIDFHQPGTSCQEVIRVLIDRVIFLNGQKPHQLNEAILHHLRMAIAGFEARAIMNKVEKGFEIETLRTAEDGHIVFKKKKET
jgi:hypothetical protein